MSMEITCRPFGTTADGREVQLYRLQNKNGAYVCLLDWGARIQAIGVPDKTGRIVDVCLGFENVAGYERSASAYIGACIGRNANRIEGARFRMNGIVYHLDANEGHHQLHGGVHGFDSFVWACVPQEHMVSFYRNSPHMEEGFPGLLRVTVNYELSSTNDLIITSTAMSDADTPVNLTNHAYFNLAGAGSIADHTLQLAAARYTPVREDLIPTGQIAPVAQTDYDLRTARRLGDVLAGTDPMLRAAQGLDVNYVLDGEGMRTAAVLTCPQSGIRMTCQTDTPCLQVYTANYLHAAGGKGGASYGPYSAVCLETQRYPNAVNCPAFPSVVLPARAILRTRTIYSFDLAPQR